MKTKRLLALLSAGALSVSMLAGCGSTAKPADTASDSAAADPSASADSDLEYVKSHVSSFIPQTTFVFAKITLFTRLGKSRSGFSSEAALP